MKSRILLGALLFGGTTLMAPLLGAQEEIDVEKIWARNCKKCHGADGKGDTRAGKKMDAKDYTDPEVQKMFTDEEAYKITAEGLIDEDGKEVMKPMKDKLSEAEIHALVAYVRAFAKG
jgi:cytochrome c6